MRRLASTAATMPVAAPSSGGSGLLRSVQGLLQCELSTVYRVVELPCVPLAASDCWQARRSTAGAKGVSEARITC